MFTNCYRPGAPPFSGNISPDLDIADEVADDAAEFEDATQSAFGQILVFWDIPNDRCGSVVFGCGWRRFSKSNETQSGGFVMGFDGMSLGDVEIV